MTELEMTTLNTALAVDIVDCLSSVKIDGSLVCRSFY
jgi:hypothetical protein